MKPLPEIFSEHKGKVSSKWSSYLRDYDRILSIYRDKPIRLLEIGVQNGGSLDIWSTYFKKGKVFVGCDIDENCTKLVYDDPRINFVLGDANIDKTELKICSHSGQFDVIIDDGSHFSSDVIKAFPRYFKHLANGGVFIVEDLHCSYWEIYEGGIYHPHSSLSFFKQLTDVINFEHWGVDNERKQILQSFAARFDLDFDNSILAEIHSIEFINSMCIIRKRKEQDNVLGLREYAGHDELIPSGFSDLKGTYNIPESQRNNKFSMMDLAPESEEWNDLQKALEQSAKTMSHLKENTKSSADHIADLYSSNSWKITKPLRILSKIYTKIRRFIASNDQS